MLGDCLYGYRAALDHLAYRLVQLEQGSASNDSMFPVFDDCVRFRKGGFRWIAKMGAAAQTAIMQRQPCYRRPPHARHLDPLTLLNDLGNVDKHRRLHLLGSVPTAYGQYGAEPADAETSYHSGPFEDNTVIMTYRYRTPHPQIDVRPVAAFGIAFPEGEPGYAQTVEHTLLKIRTEVVTILNEFESAFFGTSGCHDDAP